MNCYTSLIALFFDKHCKSYGTRHNLQPQLGRAFDYTTSVGLPKI